MDINITKDNGEWIKLVRYINGVGVGNRLTMIGVNKEVGYSATIKYYLSELKALGYTESRKCFGRIIVKLIPDDVYSFRNFWAKYAETSSTVRIGKPIDPENTEWLTNSENRSKHPQETQTYG